MTTRAQLTAIIGEKAVAALIAWHPGRSLRVPKTPAILAPVIGKHAAIALSRALPHTILRIPLANKRIDRAQALALLQSGDSPAVIARKLGFTRKTIERLRAGARQDRAASPPSSGRAAGSRRPHTPGRRPSSRHPAARRADHIDRGAG
jgi:hypothetical protein